MEIGRLSKIVEGLVGVLLDAFKEQRAIEETIFFRSNVAGIFKFVFSSITDDFAD
jgi:hypothetical protein